MPVEGEPYTIMARHSGLRLDVLGRSQQDGAIVSQYADQGAKGVQQKWIFETVPDREWLFGSVPEGLEITHRIKNANSGRYLTAWRGLPGIIHSPGYASRWIAQLARSDADQSQYWCLRPAEDGYFRIQSCDLWDVGIEPALFLDVIGQSLQNDAILGLWPQTAPGYQQMWRLTPVNPITSEPEAVGTATLKWELYCQTTCNKEETEQVVTVNGTETSVSHTTKQSITNSIKAGFKYGAFSVEASHSQTSESSTSRSEAESF